MILRLTLLIFAAFIGLGFRPISPEERARMIVKSAEEHLSLDEHAELYRYVRVDSEGEVFQGSMLIIFRYDDNIVSGVFRLIPDDDNKGVTLISRQEPNKTPKLSFFDANTEKGGPVALENLRQKLGDTDWFFEGIYDDDHNPWSYRRVRTVSYRGNTVNVIEARYTDPSLKEASGYEYRNLLIRQSDEQPLAVEFNNANGEVIFVIDLLSKEKFEFEGSENSRAKQFQLIDFEANSTTVLTRVRSNWAPQLPDEIFELDYAEKWDAETDAMIVRKLKRDFAPR